MFRPFFVHKFYSSITEAQTWKRPGSPQRRGFTVYVQPDPNNVRNVLVQVSLCSMKDAFCKHVGRIKALGHTASAVPTRQLDKFLKKLAAENMHMDYEDFGYLYKFMV